MNRYTIALTCVALLVAGAAVSLAQPQQGPPPGGPGIAPPQGPGGPPPDGQGPRNHPDGMCPMPGKGMHGMGMRGMAPMDDMPRMGAFLGILSQISTIAKDPVAAGVIAIGGLKDDVKRPPEQIIADLEKALEQTKSLALRNALRMTLKDLYKQQGQNDKVLATLQAMLKENDDVLSGGK